MNKCFLIVLLTGVLINISINETVEAKSSGSPQPLEEFLPAIGYKTVESALKDFERHFNKELKLPLRVPPISFTHQFGRFSDSDGDINDEFEVTMISTTALKPHA
ncbi:hypothetical protein ACIQXF_07570 [Lysinibacillus sp. NPDC097231]|uniref:hypothetical protein n=1 Tax=Lysinibacillus sp. NPDC097231 TaxID=3364142 RepID=UPI003830E239